MDKLKTNIKRRLERFEFFQKMYMDRYYPRYGGNRKYVFCKGKKIAQICEMLRNISINVNTDTRFVHWIDEDIALYQKGKVIGNMPPKYELILNYSLNDLLEKNTDGSEIGRQNCRLLMEIMEYVNRIIKELENSNTKNKEKKILWFENMKEKSAISLEEALQRILFWSSLFWQSGHKLIGIGRIDKLLEPYLDSGSGQELEDILVDFMKQMHEHYTFKSASLLGDIGQIMIIGGLERDNSYYRNEITDAVISATKKVQITDPKVLLRVSSNMPKDLLMKAIECIATGCGSPLLSNDDVVVPCLKEFGYTDADAHDYVTSACWEPLSYGNALEQNNIGHIEFADAFVSMMKNEKIVNAKSLDDIMCMYEEALRQQIRGTLRQLDEIIWEDDPLFSLFTEDCKEKNLDIAKGGAKYNNYGILSVGLANAVDSLINLNTIVFEKQTRTMEDMHLCWKQENISALSDLADESKELMKTFGHDEKKVIELVNNLITIVKDEILNYRNCFGGKAKFGLSSPSYVTLGEKTGFTLDGRKNGDPLHVHISASDGVAITELLSFAAGINYDGQCSNGNVVDYFVTPSLINENREVFESLVSAAIEQGFFQMQMNVVSSEKLIDAKKNPELYANLIVRVWGFSAYFKDIPEEYQDVLIERALRSEGKIA